MNNRRNFYRILQVQPEASPEIIKASYRTLMQKLKHHPDLGGDVKQAALINEAYATLSNPKKRIAYDKKINSKIFRNDCRSNTATNSNKNVQPKKKKTQQTNLKENQCIFCHFKYNKKNTKLNLCPSCSSPMRNHENNKQWEQERKSNRIKHHARIEVFTEWPQEFPFLGTIKNLSPTGVLFTTATPMIKKQIIKLSNENLSAIAEVIHCQQKNKSDYQIGIKFLTLNLLNSPGTFISEQA